MDATLRHDTQQRLVPMPTRDVKVTGELLISIVHSLLLS